MKNIFIAISFVITALNTQAQAKLSKPHIDEFTGNKVSQTEYFTIGRDQLNYKWEMKVLTGWSNGYDVYILSAYSPYADLGCWVEDKSEAILILGDGTRMTLPYFGDIECGKGETFSAVLDEDQVEILKKQVVKKIRFSGTEYKSDIKVKQKYQTYIGQGFKDAKKVLDTL